MAQQQSYRVLARKYRPLTFKDMIGQESLVRVLSNGIESGRLPHAFIFTGIRGVGKTTTARIMARSLNCESGPTVTPCGTCEPCLSILQDRSVDVIEIDAASQTGVDDIRHIIESVSYRPVLTRYKIYIIDEVHMLSKNAFNALLKTLEEPPSHVKFIFATTEIRKVPPTVLSRCMRFDLRRMGDSDLVPYYTKLLDQEGIMVEPLGVQLIARFADGSVRDGLSMLDQAINLGGNPVTAQHIQEMLGLMDRAKVFELWKAIMGGQADIALGLYKTLQSLGMDPEMLAQELLEITHSVTCLKVAPAYAPPILQEVGEDVVALAGSLSLGSLTLAWQLLLKGLEEIMASPSASRSMEMLIIRVCYGCDLQSVPMTSKKETTQYPKTFEDFVDWIGAQKDPMVYAHLIHDVHLIKYAAPKIVIGLSPKAPKDFVATLQKLVGADWSIEVQQETGEVKTLATTRQDQKEAAQEEVLNTPLVQGILDQFPGTTIKTD